MPDYLTFAAADLPPLNSASLAELQALAAVVQARIKGQLQAKATKQTSPLSDFDFLLSEEATFKFT